MFLKFSLIAQRYAITKIGSRSGFVFPNHYLSGFIHLPSLLRKKTIAVKFDPKRLNASENVITA